MITLFLDLIDSEEDKQFFIEIHDLYKKPMFGIAKEMLENTQLSEDAVQEAFIKIAKNISKLSINSCADCPQIRKYIVLTIRSVCLDMLRKQKHTIYETELDENLETEELSCYIENEIIDKISKKELFEKFSSLSLDERELLTLFFVNELTIGEIGKTLGINREAAKKRIQRIIGRLRKELIE